MKKYIGLMFLILSLGIAQSRAQDIPDDVTIQLGELNSMAKILPMPKVSNARRFRIKGDIYVRVKIDLQKGKVIAATIESEAPAPIELALLKAANGAKFEPVLPEFPDLRGIGFIKYTINDFNKPVRVKKQPRGLFIITQGVLNSKALRVFPLPAAVRSGDGFIAGKVEVAVLVLAREGRVLAANAISGPGELRAGSKEVAIKVKFSSTNVNGGGPIYVKGLIVYTFTKDGRVE